MNEIDPGADLIYRQELEAFTKAMLLKAYGRYRQRKMDGMEFRRMDPWNHDLWFLWTRFDEEVKELREAGEKDEDVPDELLDVANFCFYLWTRISSIRSDAKIDRNDNKHGMPSGVMR